MTSSNYIKVTPRGETKPRIVLASLKQFFISQRAKVEPVSEEELYELEPSLRPRQAVSQPAVAPDQLDAFRKQAAETVHELEAVCAEKDAIIKEREATIEDLREKLAASEASVKESEKVIENLRKEAEKAAKSATKADAKEATNP